MKFYSLLLVTVFGKIFDWLAAFIGKKVAAGGAVIATSLVLLTAFYLAMKLAVVGIVHQISNPTMLQAFYVLWPSNAEICISAYWTAQVVTFIYREHRQNLRDLAYVT